MIIIFGEKQYGGYVCYHRSRHIIYLFYCGADLDSILFIISKDTDNKYFVNEIVRHKLQEYRANDWNHIIENLRSNVHKIFKIGRSFTFRKPSNQLLGPIGLVYSSMAKAELFVLEL